MRNRQREAFRDYLLDRSAVYKGTEGKKQESGSLETEEEKAITAGWYADDGISQAEILEVEKELLEREWNAGRETHGQDTAAEPDDWEEDEENPKIPEPEWDTDRENDGQDTDEETDEENKEHSNVYVRGWSFPTNIKELEQEFREYYTSYVMNHDAEVEQWLEKELIQILGELCTYKIYLRIRYHYAYNLGEEMRIAHDGHISAMEYLKRSKKENRFLKESEALPYFRAIYLNKTRDYFRYWKRKSETDIPLPTDEEIHQKPKEHGEIVQKSQGYIFQGRKSKKYYSQVHKVLKLYFQELMDYTGEPTKALAVMYARILYQIEPLYDPEVYVEAVMEVMRKKQWSLDPDSKRYEEHWNSAERVVQEQSEGASPAWAIKRMGSQTIEELEDDSEKSMRRNFDRTLAWGASMRGMLSKASGINKDVLWKDIVFTKHYTQSKIQEWSASVHESTLIRTAGIMATDDSYREIASNVLEDAHPLMKEYKKRASGKRKKKGGRANESFDK